MVPHLIEFKHPTAVVRAWVIEIGFEEFHDKLIEYKAFLKHEENETAGMIAKFHISISSSMEINLKREKKKEKERKNNFQSYNN